MTYTAIIDGPIIAEHTGPARKTVNGAVNAAIKAAGNPQGKTRIQVLEDGACLFVAHGDSPHHAIDEVKSLMARNKRRYA